MPSRTLSTVSEAAILRGQPCYRNPSISSCCLSLSIGELLGQLLVVVPTCIPPEMWRFLASQGGKRAPAWSGAGQVLGRAYRRQRSSLQLPIHSLTHSLIHSVTAKGKPCKQGFLRICCISSFLHRVLPAEKYIYPNYTLRDLGNNHMIMIITWSVDALAPL